MNPPSVAMIEAFEALAEPVWGQRQNRAGLGPGDGWIVGVEFVEDEAPAHLSTVARSLTRELGDRTGRGWALGPGAMGYLQLVVWGDR